MELEDVPRLRTRRLELVAATAELARAAVQGNEALARALEVRVPDAWPPALYGEHQAQFADELEKDPALAGWSAWYIVEARGPTLVGSMGFTGRPSSGAVEIGYSMIDSHQRRGFATEAMGGLIDWAFSHDDVRIVRAHTLPDLKASIRVMEKNGLSCVGAGDEPGTLRFELRRP